MKPQNFHLCIFKVTYSDFVLLQKKHGSVGEEDKDGNKEEC